MSELKVSGKVIKVLPPVSGEGQRGGWVKQDFVIETDGEYPKNICFTSWGNIVEVVEKLVVGSSIEVSFNPESREYNDRWYTDLKAWRIKASSQQESKPTEKPAAEKPAAEKEDDLPF